nr:peptidase [Mobiluncus sp. Marseille-Q7826]
MKTSHCDPRLLTRFTNRALVIGSSAALTLGLGMTGFVPAAFATETPTPEVPSQESPAAPTPVTDPAPSDADAQNQPATDPAPSDADAQNQPATDPAANDSAASVNLATPVKAPPAPADSTDPAVPSGSNFAHPEKVKTVEDSKIYRTWWLTDPVDSVKSDALVKRTADDEYDTQHKETFKVNPGDTLDIKSNLDISVGYREMKNYQERVISVIKDNGAIRHFKITPNANNFTYDKADSVIETFISVPEYLEMPDDPQSYTLETHNGDNPLYRIKSVLRSAKRLAIKLTLNESYEKGNWKKGAYPRLRDSFAAYVNKPLSLVISGVKVKDNIPPEGARAKLKFETIGYLKVQDPSSINRWESDAILLNFSQLFRHWSSVQDPEGLDSEPIYNHIVSLTMDVKPKPTPAEPENPNPNQPVIPDTPSVVPGPIPGGTLVPPSDPEPPVAGVTTPADPEPPVAGVVTTPTEPQPPVAGVVATPTEPQPPVAGVFTPAAPRIPVTQVPEKALAATGSSAETLAGGAMIVFLAGGAMMVVSRRRARR